MPGSALSHENHKKFWVSYCSFLELGPLILQREESWLCCFAKRSSEVAKLMSGISQAFAAQVRLFFGEAVADLSTGGMELRSSTGQATRLWCKLGMVLQDGGAHKLVFACKGDGATRPCILCKNLVSLRSSELVRGALFSSEVWAEGDAVLASDEDVRRTIRRLDAAAGHVSATELAIMQQACGFNHAPRSMLSCPVLLRHVKPVSQFAHDWCHCLLVNGVFQTVTHLLLTSLAASCLPNVYKSVRDYMAMWKFPLSAKTSASAATDIFSPKRAASNKSRRIQVHCQRRPLRLPRFGFFVQMDTFSGHCESEIRAFLCLCDVLDLFQAVPLGLITHGHLGSAVEAFLQACLRANWREQMHPKFHWLVHFPKQLRTFGCLPSCFVHERKHKVAKRYANSIHNTRVFETSLLGEIVSHDLSVLAKPHVFDFQVGLVEPKPASAKLLRFLDHNGSAKLCSCTRPPSWHMPRQRRSPFRHSRRNRVRRDPVSLRVQRSHVHHAISLGAADSRFQKRPG